MEKVKSNGLTGRIWLGIVILGLAGQLAWVIENMYFNVYLFDVIGASASDIAAMVKSKRVLFIIVIN